MKRFLALAALILGMVSCQTEPEGLDVIVGGEVDTYITVALPEATRANSADGFNLSTLGTTDYNLRYILEIYRVEDEQVLYSTCQRFVETSDNTSMVFPVRLAPGYNYRIVAWTDIVEGNSKEDRYYYTEAGLDEIAILDNGTVNWNAMDETRDAYTCVKVVNNFNSASNLDMTLTRPFAKVRVVATDIEDILKVGLEPKSATVEYAQDMFFKYNAVAGTYAHTYSKNHNISYPATPVYEDATGEMTLFADYIFVPSTGTAKFSLNVYADANQSKLIKSNNFNTEIFVERNKLTTIKGDVLTVGGNVKVTVDNGLGVKDVINIVDTPNSLIDAIEDAQPGEETNIELGGDIDLSELFGAGILSTRAAEPTYGLLIPAGSEVVLDLNGFTIRQTKKQTGAYQMIQNLGTLTIKDSSADKTGKLVYGDTGNGGEYVSNTIQNSGVLTIESGTILNNSGSDVASAGYPHPIDNSGTLTIKGGTFTNNANYSSMRIWCTTDDDTIVTIDGGTFNGSIDFQTPSASANKGTLTIKGGIFNADTYTNTAVRLLGFGADVDEMNGYIKGGEFNGAIALKNWSGGEFNSKVFDITGGTFTADPSEFVNDDYIAKQGENGLWNVHFVPATLIGETAYNTLEDAVAAAKAGDTITLNRDITISSVTLPAGIIFNGNGKQINGSINAGGDLTFVDHTKVTSFSASYYDRVITIGEGACLEVTGGGRVTLGYGNIFNITGSVENAKTADKANIQPSLIIPGGISITGGNDATMNVNNAYVKIGSTSSKNSAANGTFTLNFNNAVAEFTNQLTFAEPTNGMNPTFNLNIVNSVLTTGTKLILAAPLCEMNVDNSTINISTYFGNSGVVTLTNGSELTGSCIQDNEGINHRGSTTVDNSTFTINATSPGHAFDGKGTGSITATEGATVTVQYYKDMTINVDATSTFTGTDIYGNRKIYYTGDEKVAPTDENAFGGAGIVSNVWDKTTGKGVITFDRDLTTIGDRAFQRVTNTTPSNWATSITLPASVTSIGDYAFAQCYSLKTITIPDGVTTIGQYAFQSCDAVTTVTIGSRVSTIGSGAFYNCYEIKEFNCKSATPPALADNWVFNGVEKTATVYVPAASVDTYKNAEFWSNFTNIVGK